MISVQWIASDSQANNNRVVDAAINGTYGPAIILTGFSNVISGFAVSSDDFVTNQTANYMEWTNITPDGSGNIELAWSQGAGNNAFYTALTAMRIEVIPEPSTFLLMGVSLMSLVLFRRRNG